MALHLVTCQCLLVYNSHYLLYLKPLYSHIPLIELNHLGLSGHMGDGQKGGGHKGDGHKGDGQKRDGHRGGGYSGGGRKEGSRKGGRLQEGAVARGGEGLSRPLAALIRPELPKTA